MVTGPAARQHARDGSGLPPIPPGRDIVFSERPDVASRAAVWHRVVYCCPLKGTTRHAEGTEGEWRPRDDRACSVHVMKVLTGEIEETFEAPADERRPPDPAAGGRADGRARASKMTAEERAASARRAAEARWVGETR